MTDDERSIRGLIATWQRAAAAGDLPLLLSLMAEDGRVSHTRPAANPRKGRIRCAPPGSAQSFSLPIARGVGRSDGPRGLGPLLGSSFSHDDAHTRGRRGPKIGSYALHSAKAAGWLLGPGPRRQYADSRPTSDMTSCMPHENSVSVRCSATHTTTATLRASPSMPAIAPLVGWRVPLPGDNGDTVALGKTRRDAGAMASPPSISLNARRRDQDGSSHRAPRSLHSRRGRARGGPIASGSGGDARRRYPLDCDPGARSIQELGGDQQAAG